MQLSVIIVSYNVKYFVEQCLYAVIKACKGIDAEIFVVDNCSVDGSREWLEPRFPGVQFKWKSTNMGFGKASNSVLADTRGEHVLFLNPDTVIAEDSLKKCLDFFAAKPQCGALGVRMVDGSGKFLKESKRSFPSAKFSIFKLAGLAGLFPSSKNFAGYYAGHLDDATDHDVQVLAGAFMMLSRKAINVTGGFDEDFFMYGEDIDLSYRILRAGMQNWYFAGTTIIHFKGESTQKLSAPYTEHFYGAMQLFLKKHYKRKRAVSLLLHLSISAVKAVTEVRHLASPLSGPPQTHTPAQTAIVAGQARFNETLQLIKYATVPLVVSGRISTELTDKDSCIGHIGALPELAKKNGIQQIVFCEGEMTFKEIIQQVSDPRIKAVFLFTAAGSDSMVGSNDKNARGFFIARPVPSLSKATSGE